MDGDLLLNLRSPRDYVGPPFLRSSVPPFLRSPVPPFLRSSVPPFLRSSVPPFLRSFVRSRLWYFLSLLDGASVREAHCAQATVARLVTFESLKWKYSFATNSALFMKLGSLLYVRCRNMWESFLVINFRSFLYLPRMKKMREREGRMMGRE